MGATGERIQRLMHEIDKITTKTSEGAQVTADPYADLSIGADITKAMARQPGLLGYYVMLAEVAEARRKKLKYMIHCMYEDLDAKVRSIAAQNDEKLTEPALKNRINRNPKMRALYEKYLIASRTAGLLYGYKEAFRQRGEMLRSIGANRRTEQEQSELQTMTARKKRVLKEG
jgi:hypothetical protein